MNKLLVILFCILCALGIQRPTLADEKALIIWQITDVHHLSTELYDEGSRIQEMQATAAGMDIFYSDSRMEALIHQIEQADEQPDYLLVSGDLTLNGEYQSLLDMRDYFTRIEELGTEILVMPGNHDINNGWSSSFSESKSYTSQQITTKNFVEVLGDFGYKEALSRDEGSLSYSIQLADNHRLILLDSNIYYPDKNNQPPISEGQVSSSTLQWLENQLTQADKEGSHSTVAIHHNAFPHFTNFGRSFAITNYQNLIAVLEKYQVPVTFSGHIHAQNIGNFTDEDYTLQDITTGAFSVYPSSIGVIKLKDDGGEYQRILLDVEDWVKDIDLQDPDLIEYSEYMKQVFITANARITQRQAQGGPQDMTYSALAQFLGELNLAFFAGEIRERWEELETTHSDALEELSQQEENNLSSYWSLLFSQRELDHQSTSWKYK